MDNGNLCLACLNAYHRIYPGSFFKRRLEAKEMEQARKSMVFIAFSELCGGAKDDKDCFFILRAIDKDPDRVYRMLMLNRDEQISRDMEGIRKSANKEDVDRFLKYLKEEKSKI